MEHTNNDNTNENKTAPKPELFTKEQVKGFIVKALEFNQKNVEVKNNIKNSFVKNGGNKEAFDDFYKMN